MGDFQDHWQDHRRIGPRGQFIRPALFALATLFPLAACASTPPGGMSVDVNVSGDGSAHIKLDHAGDAQHSCTSAALPWSHATVNGQEVEIPPGPPIYDVRFAASDPSSDPSAAGFDLSVMFYSPGMTSQSNAADDTIAISQSGSNWRATGSTSGFTINVTFAPDGKSGTFKARGLREVPASGAAPSARTINVEGSWSCPSAK